MKSSCAGMGDKHWYMQFDVGDWLSDEAVSLLRAPTRGIWMDAICAMFKSDRSGLLTGTVCDLSRLCRCTSNEMRAAIDDLKLRNAADVTECNGIVTLLNRRMRREWTDRKSILERVKRHRGRQRNANVTPDVTPPVTPHSKSNSNSNSKTPKPPPAGADESAIENGDAYAGVSAQTRRIVTSFHATLIENLNPRAWHKWEQVCRAGGKELVEKFIRQAVAKDMTGPRLLAWVEACVMREVARKDQARPTEPPKSKRHCT